MCVVFCLISVHVLHNLFLSCFAGPARKMDTSKTAASDIRQGLKILSVLLYQMNSAITASLLLLLYHLLPCYLYILCLLFYLTVVFLFILSICMFIYLSWTNESYQRVRYIHMLVGKLEIYYMITFNFAVVFMDIMVN